MRADRSIGSPARFLGPSSMTTHSSDPTNYVLPSFIIKSKLCYYRLRKDIMKVAAARPYQVKTYSRCLLGISKVAGDGTASDLS